MAPKRGRRNRRGRQSQLSGVLIYTFEGLANFSVGSGNVSEVNITYKKLGVDLTRPSRPISARLSATVTRNDALNFQIAGVQPLDNTVEVNSAVVPVSGTVRSLSIVFPRNQNYLTPSGDDVVLKLRAYTAQSESTSVHCVYSGEVRVQFQQRDKPSSIKPN